jgi:transposase
MEHLYLGIDVSKTFSQVFALKRDGVVVADGKRTKTLDMNGWRERLGAWAHEYVLHAAFEIGPHYDWMYDLLREYCQEVVVVNAGAFKLIAQSQKKTDRLDAQRLAEGLLRGDLPDVWVPDRETRADRRLVSFVHYASQALTKIKGRIRGLLLASRLECPARDVLSSKSIAWLRESAAPQMDQDGQMMLRMLLEQAEVLLRQRGELDVKVRERVKRYAAAEIVQSVPGFGPLTALAILCAVAEIGRFDSPQKLASYFGVCGSVWQSGATCRFGPMTKRGNVHVRWLLAQALLHLHKKDTKARARYQRLKRKKHRGVARGAMMRWLVNVLWHVWTKGELYRVAGGKKAA